MSAGFSGVNLVNTEINNVLFLIVMHFYCSAVP